MKKIPICRWDSAEFDLFPVKKEIVGRTRVVDFTLPAFSPTALSNFALHPPEEI
jgi:hypothetical protein